MLIKAEHVDFAIIWHKMSMFNKIWRTLDGHPRKKGHYMDKEEIGLSRVQQLFKRPFEDEYVLISILPCTLIIH